LALYEASTQAEIDAQDEALRQAEFEAGLEGTYTISSSESEYEPDDSDVEFVPPVRGTHDAEAGGSGSVPVTVAQPISQAPPAPIPPPAPTTDPAMQQTLHTLTQVLSALQQTSHRQDQTLQLIQQQQELQAKQLAIQNVQIAEQARRHDEQMQFWSEQMRRQQDVINYQLSYLYRLQGVAAPPPYPGPPLDSAPQQPGALPSPIRPMTSLGSSSLPVPPTGTTCVTPGLVDISTTFGTPSSAFVSQFVSTPAVTAIQTETLPRTVTETVPESTTLSEILGVTSSGVSSPPVTSFTSLLTQETPVVTSSGLTSFIDATLAEAEDMQRRVEAEQAEQAPELETEIQATAPPQTEIVQSVTVATASEMDPARTSPAPDA
jgi:hypothetical protein